MADAVERALEDRRVLLCEAGTGTGKTFAYLVPALLSGLKVIVSTATKALQEQIVFKDVPLIAEHLGLAGDVALAKGLGNYVCRRRFEELRSSAGSQGDGGVRRALPLVEMWVAESETGDIGELASLREDDPLWREIASSSDTRIGASCDYYEACFVTRMKRDAERARIVVVNHHLFFGDLAVRSAAKARGFASAGALPPYDAVIFDEAHELEDVATSFFGVRLSRLRVDAMLRDADRAFLAHGLSDRLLSKGEGSAIAAIVREASDAFFHEVGAAAQRGKKADASRVPLGRDDVHGPLEAAVHRLDNALEALAELRRGQRRRRAGPPRLRAREPDARRAGAHPRSRDRPRRLGRDVGEERRHRLVARRSLGALPRPRLRAHRRGRAQPAPRSRPAAASTSSARASASTNRRPSPSTSSRCRAPFDFPGARAPLHAARSARAERRRLRRPRHRARGRARRARRRRRLSSCAPASARCARSRSA